MARVTVEDCIDKVSNRFDLVLLAAQRASENDQLGFGAHAHAYRRGSEVAHVEVRSQTLLPRRKQLLHRSQGRRLDQIDHHRRRQHMHAAAAHFRRGVLFFYHQLGRAFQADTQCGNINHAVLLNRIADANGCKPEKP